MELPRAQDKAKFYYQRGDAAKRGILFLLTFEEWWEIWQKSGHWHERGSGLGQYVMARFGDIGPYAVGNVKIITNKQNTAEYQQSGRRPRRAGHSMNSHARRQARYRNRQRARLIELEKEIASLKTQLPKLRAKDDDDHA
jgi:hypothetical protein